MPRRRASCQPPHHGQLSVEAVGGAACGSPLFLLLFMLGASPLRLTRLGVMVRESLVCRSLGSDSKRAWDSMAEASRLLPFHLSR